VVHVPTELLTKNGRATLGPVPAAETADDELREWARQHLERVRRLKLNVAAFLIGIVALTPVWLLVEWQDNGGFKHWSNNGNPGDWEPWILYVALVWGLIVAISALKVHFDRPTTDVEIEREVERLRSAS
jgi:hypothetical protein